MLAEKYCAPVNKCNFLTVPRVNPGIWNNLPRASRKLDVGLQEAQKSAVHAVQAIAIAVESLIRCKKEKTGRVELEIIARLPVRLFVFHCNGSFQVSLKRTELLKPDLSKNIRCFLFPVYASVSLPFLR